MLKNIQKTETQENRASGMEGLAVSVIETAMNDLKAANGHSQSAIHFLKHCPELLEFWLSVATHGGKRNLDLNVAKQKLYARAKEAEQLYSQRAADLHQKKELKRLLKRAEKRTLSPTQEKHLKALQEWAASRISENQKLEAESKIATHSSRNTTLYKMSQQHIR